MSTPNSIQLVRDCLTAWKTNDRALLEGLLAEDFTFTSPQDDHLSRAEFWRVCWANSQMIHAYDILNLVENEGDVLIRYECELTDGKRFRNMEHFTIRAGKIAAVEVYFGRQT